MVKTFSLILPGETFFLLSYTAVDVFCPGQVTEPLSVPFFMKLGLR